MKTEIKKFGSGGYLLCITYNEGIYREYYYQSKDDAELAKKLFLKTYKKLFNK